MARGPALEAARREVAAHKEFERLCREYVSIAEALAQARRAADDSDESPKRGLKSRSSRTRKSRG